MLQVYGQHRQYHHFGVEPHDEVLHHVAGVHE